MTFQNCEIAFITKSRQLSTYAAVERRQECFEMEA